MPALGLHESPRSRYAVPPLVDLSVKSERSRLSPSAFKAFLNIMEKWRITDAKATALLGGMSSGKFYALKKDPHGAALDQDKLSRVSSLVGIFKALNILYGEELADTWVQLPNQNRIFAGATPLSYMLRGGLPAFQTVRRLLDARRGGA